MQFSLKMLLLNAFKHFCCSFLCILHSEGKRATEKKWLRWIHWIFLNLLLKKTLKDKANLLTKANFEIILNALRPQSIWRDVFSPLLPISITNS